MHDRKARTTTRISVDSSGKQATGTSPYSNSFAPAISADGRFVAFSSGANNLLVDDTNLCEKSVRKGPPIFVSCSDVFLRDRLLNGKPGNVAVTVNGSPASVQPGQEFFYSFTVTNKGNTPVTGVTLTDVLSSQLQVLAVTPTVAGNCNRAHVVVCRLGNLGAGQKAHVGVKVKVNADARGTLSNTVTVDSNERDILAWKDNRREVNIRVE